MGWRTFQGRAVQKQETVCFLDAGPSMRPVGWCSLSAGLRVAMGRGWSRAGCQCYEGVAARSQMPGIQETGLLQLSQAKPPVCRTRPKGFSATQSRTFPQYSSQNCPTVE